MTNDLATETARATAAEAVNSAAHAAYVVSNDAAIAAESGIRIAAEAAMQADVDLNEADADAAIAALDAATVASFAALQADVDGNEFDADASFVALQADVDGNEADADAAIDALDIATSASFAALQADVDGNEFDADASFAAMLSVQEMTGIIAHDGSAIVFISGVASSLTMGVGATGESVKVKSKVAIGDVTISGNIEGSMASSVTLSDNGAVTLVADAAGMWWII